MRRYQMGQGLQNLTSPKHLIIHYCMRIGLITPIPDNKVSKGAKIKNRYNQRTTPDPGYQWESDKLTVRHHKREPRGHPFPSR